MVFGKYINVYYKKYWLMIVLGILSLVVVDYYQLKVPALYQLVVNGMNDGVVAIDGTQRIFDMDFLLEYICKPLLWIILAVLVGRFLWRVCFFGVAVRMETDLRGLMFDHCKDLSQQFYATNKVGSLMSLFTNDLETVQDCFGSGIMMLCDALLLGVLAIGKMIRMNVWLTLMALVPMAFLMLISVIIGRSLMDQWEVRQEAFSSLSDFSQENFSGIAVIKAFVKEAAELMAFGKLNEYNEKVNVDYMKTAVKLRVCVMLFVESVICVILGYGGHLVHEHIFNAGQLVEFIGYFTSIVWPVMAVSELIEMRSRGAASVKRITELLDTKPDVVDREDVEDVDVLHGDIEFRDLTFRYPGGEYDVLSDVSFRISAGENVGIIGRTGSGKTTMVDLILRTYNVPDGTIFLDGRDINSLPIRTVRANAAYVPQDNFLFSDTIENNIMFAVSGGSHDEAEFAAKMADVHDNISDFSAKYETILGERGVTVSGGQKQRISIARALMKNAPILILDDSVSAVDVDTEKTILDNLRTMREGKTTILIAHRISTIEKMDRVLFLDEGRIAGSGSHRQLYETCPGYREMVDLQRLDDAGKEEEENG